MAQDWWAQQGLNYPTSGGTFSQDELARVSGQTRFGITDPGQGGIGATATQPQGNPQKTGSPAADWQAFVQSKGYTGTYGRTNMPQLVQEFNQTYGYNATPGNPNASGQTDTIDFGDGSGLRDVIHGGDNAWQNIADNPYGGGGSVGSLGVMADGSLLTPWTEQFQAPDPNQIAQNPEYQFQLGQGLQGVQRSAAAKGTLLTGGTLKSLATYGQGLASSFGNTLYNRALGEYGLRKANFQENQDRPYTKLSGLATLGKPQTLQPPTG